MLHYGGLDNFHSAFGSDSDFFKGKPWYVGAFNGGADSAQIFEAGGYRFLHIGLEMAPEDDVIAWAEGLLRKYPGLPTIISRSEEHTSELQSLMRISYAVFCLKKKT